MAADEPNAAPEELPGQQRMFEEEPRRSSRSGDKRASAHLKGTRALERLRDRVNLAVKELHRLRDENHALNKEIEALKREGSTAGEGAGVQFNESADELRDKLEQYIEPIDELIRREESAEEEA